MVSDIYGRLDNNQLLSIKSYASFRYMDYSMDWLGFLVFVKHGEHRVYRCQASARIVLKLARLV